jgi:hypothetical protein|tara:strand:+ start:82 stop:450 length:369 start_codon:yes stop_codon:yes gene_type:complete
MSQKNVLKENIELCCKSPMTGFYRDGFCNTGKDDLGLHLVCVQVTTKFLEFSKKVGNDLSTPIPEYEFPGLKDGDKWCLCASRWIEAYENNCAPNVYILSTNHEVLKIIPIDILKKYSVDLG